MRPEDIQISRVRWEDSGPVLAEIRREVFIMEQGVPAELELDDHDATARHFLALAPDGEPIGTARLLPSGRIGRVAVLSSWRGKGIGRVLMTEVLRAACEPGLPRPHLHAQVPTIPFYESLGFVVCGEGFEEAGIAHQPMELAGPTSKNTLTPT